MTQVGVADAEAEVRTVATCGGRRSGRLVPFVGEQSIHGLGYATANECPAMQLNVSRLQDAYVLVGPGRDCVIVDRHGRAIKETCTFTHYDPEHYTLDKLQAQAQPIEQPLFVTLDGSWRNYYHWTLFGLGRSQIYRRLQPDPFQILMLDHVARHVPGWEIGFSHDVWADSLRRTGLSEHCRFVDEGVYRVATLDYMWQTVDQPPYLSFFPQLYEGFQAIAECIGSPPLHRKIIVSRPHNPRLTATATEALHRLATYAGFEFIALETMSFEEQVALFASSRVVVAPHGAGLVNLVYASPQTKVVELIPHLNGEAGLRPWFYLLAAGKGQQYSYLDIDNYDGSASAIYGRILELCEI